MADQTIPDSEYRRQVPTSPEPRDQLRAVADDMLDTLGTLAAFGLHDSKRPHLRAYVEDCRAALRVAADPHELGVAAGRAQASADIRDRAMQTVESVVVERVIATCARIAEGSP